MAMLAEPRVKKRYHLTPKGKPLFEDGDRFGTKMLEKMGWSKGKGLGKGEDGKQEFVRVKYKRDIMGLGFEERDDQWTEHEKHFSGLLNNLNVDSNTNSKSDPDDSDAMTPTVGLGFQSKKSNEKKLKDKFSGQSLEEKSKNSKARVHYKKFTKGKDISQYSEKDLANIFGKKATPEDTDIYSQFQELSSSVPIVNTGVTVNDYFKKKTEALKEKLGTSSSNPFKANVRVVNNVEYFVPPEEINCNEQSATNAEEEEDETKKEKEEAIEEEEVPRKKKKSKKKSTEIIESESLEESVTIPDAVTLEENSIRKKKKSKKPVETSGEPDTEQKQDLVKLKEENSEQPSKPKSKELDSRASENQTKIKKKNSKKNCHELENEKVQETSCSPINGDIPKKKKKKSKKRSAEDSELIEHGSDEFVPIKKKKSKNLQEDPASSSETQKDSKSLNSELVPNKNTNQMNTSPNPSTEEVSSHQTPFDPTDTYIISTFVAEKFRTTELDKYQGSNLQDLTGYGLDENLELEIRTIPGDTKRILELWDGKLDKYSLLSPKNKLYTKYMDKAKIAKNEMKWVPRLKVRSLKRKHVFGSV